MGRGPHIGPRAGSRARIALEKLHKIGGRASLLEWMRALEYTGSIVIFKRDVISHLDGVKGEWLMIFGTDAGYEINDAGLDALGIPVDAPAVAAPVLVGARYTVGLQELNTRRHCARPMTPREGAFGYRDIPSRMGDERVPYKSSLAEHNR